MDAQMDEGHVRAQHPAEFSLAGSSGRRSPTIQLNVDATRMSQAFTGGGYVQAIVTSEVNEFLNRYRGSYKHPSTQSGGEIQSGFEQRVGSGRSTM